MQWPVPGTGNPIEERIYNLSTAAVLIIALFLARRNLRRSRGDRRGATRLAMVVLALAVARHLLRVDHVSDPTAERELIERGLAWALFQTAGVWVVYLALEPYVRRRWPHTLIGWTRLLSGRYRDPMIGRDLAIGTLGGILIEILFMSAIHAPKLLGLPPLVPIIAWTSPLTGLRHVFYSWMLFAGEGIWFALTMMMMLLVLLMVLRRRWAAILGGWLILSAGSLGGSEPVMIQFALNGAAGAVMIFLLYRFGVLAGAIAFFTFAVIEASPLTLDPSAWYFDRAVIALLLIAAMIGYGFFASLGGKPALSLPMLDE